jgi:hypothetical protein
MMDWSWLPAIILFGVPAAILIAAGLGKALGGLAQKMDEWSDQSNRNRLYREGRAGFRRWLASKTGDGDAPGGVDETLVEAQRQSEAIHLLVEREIPKAVSDCFDLHRMTAEITGAMHMAGIQYEPEMAMARSRVVWLLAHTVEFLDSYPLKYEDRRLLHNAILLRKRALPICRNCPVLECAVHDLPPRCPTGVLFQIGEIQRACS